MKNLELCEKCGHLAYWDSYFQSYCCTNANCGYIKRMTFSCDYCKGKRLLLDNEDNIAVGIRENILKLVQYDKKVDYYREINYCPMCGRAVGNASRHDNGGNVG